MKENFNRGMIEDTKEEERYLKRWLHQDIDGDCSAKTPLTLPPQKKKGNNKNKLKIKNQKLDENRTHEKTGGTSRI